VSYFLYREGVGKEIIDPKLLDKLERLFKRESFNIEIIYERVIINMPVDGFSSNESYIDWLKNNKNKFLDIQSATADLCRKFKLPFQYKQWMEGYILLGKNFKDFDTTVPFNMAFWRGYHKMSSSCALEFDKDDECVKIQILPGASYREVVKFIREHNGEIQNFLNAFERRVEPTRVKRVADRDELVYSYFKKGFLDGYGRMKKEKEDELPHEVYMKICKIDMDLRRKIIQQQKQARK